MQITNISTAVMESNFDWTIIRVETDEGITGYGEAFLGPGLTAAIAEFSHILVGQDPTSIDRIVRRMKASTVYVSPGLTSHAYCGIETALLDVIGKKYGMPIWQILGGKYRDSVRIYADCHAGDALESISPMLVPRTPHWMQVEAAVQHRSIVSLKHHGWDASKKDEMDPASYARRAQEMAGRNFTLLKFDVDVPTPFETDEYNRELSRGEIDFAVSLVEAVRKAVGRDFGLAVDCHWNYSVESAIKLARALEEFDLLWLEDPVPPENIRAIGEVQRNTRATVATGENHYSRLEFQSLIVDAGLRLLAPDVQKIGLWEGRKVADIADLHHVNLTLHNISSPIGTLGGVHLCAAVPNVLALEWHAASVPFFDDIVKDGTKPLIRNGRIEVPDGPGLGIEVDEDVLYKYRKPGEKFFGN